MKINNLDHARPPAGSGCCLYGRGFADTVAHTAAGPGVGLADAAAISAGQESMAASVAYALAKKSQHSRTSHGAAAAYAYGLDAARMKDSYASSASRYRSTSFFAGITSSSSFSSGHR